MKRSYIVAGMALLILSAAMSSYAKDTIQIKGSDTMVNLGQVWSEVFNKEHPDVNISVTGGGSGTGIAALISGTCDIAESSRAIADKEIRQAQDKGVNPIQNIVALDGLAVVVNVKNPVKNLTFDQLRDIFMGNINNWQTVGGKNIPIVILSREVNSGTHIFFKEHVLRMGNSKGPEEFSPSALLMSSSQAIAEEVASNENAIGYYGMGYISPRQKTIAVGKSKNGPFIEPTTENVKANTYPISRPLYMCTNGEPKGSVKDFIEFVHSKEGQEIVKKLDFVPIK
jgi:phosphate transport system substrate-binding protein